MPRALLAAEAAGAVEEHVHEPFEAYGDLVEAPPEVQGYAVQHGCGDQRLPHCGILSPPRTVPEEIMNRGGEVMVGIHESLTARDDAVAVDVRIVPEGDVETVFQSDQAFHGIRRGAVHPDPAVPIDGHKENVGSTARFTTSRSSP